MDNMSVMASLDYEKEKSNFEKFYDKNQNHFTDAKNVYIRIIDSLIRKFDINEVPKIEGRLKKKEECIKKFNSKYRNKLEFDEHPYEIKNFISDLIGIRIVCLYQDKIIVLSEILQQHFKTLELTDKILSVESTEGSFGYKGLHLDLTLSDTMATQDKYSSYVDIPFEVQIRSIIQDAWSVLDHKIKYKKSIPIDLKRRINILSALFELADREFQEIRNATIELIHQETDDSNIESLDKVQGTTANVVTTVSSKNVSAFNFSGIACHFFRDFEFDNYKVDDFVHDILKLDSGFQKSDLHRCLKDNLNILKTYRDQFMTENPNKTFSPYTSIRHCLYLYDREIFEKILSKVARERFSEWLKEFKELNGTSGKENS